MQKNAKRPRAPLDLRTRRPYVSVNQITYGESVTGLFTIGELAAAFALSPRAIRFYEDQGLIAPQRAGTQRIYTKRDRARLQLILRGKRLGFSLADIREFLDLYDTDRTKRRQFAMTLERTQDRIRELELQLSDLTLTLGELRDMEAELLAYMKQAANDSDDDIQPSTQKGAQA